jgi:small-conductance mechanosensitive channel
VLQTSLDDFYVSYEINAYIKEPNKQAVIYSDLHQNIQDVCNERGIEIMSPHYRAARDGNRPRFLKVIWIKNIKHLLM